MFLAMYSIIRCLGFRRAELLNPAKTFIRFTFPVTSSDVSTKSHSFHKFRQLFPAPNSPANVFLSGNSPALPYPVINVSKLQLTQLRSFSQSSKTPRELRNSIRRAYQNPLPGSSQTTESRHYTVLLYLSAVVLAMLGLSYASVPLYRMFCQATGFGGTVKRKETVEDKIAKYADSEAAMAAKTREIVIRFNADVADGMPWRFLPSQREVRVTPGESTLAFYTAQNLSDQPITGVSTYNVSPMKAGAYFNKIQCFCFEEQRLRARERIDMPVFFYIDPEFAVDPKMKDVNSLTLSYTFFRVKDENEHGEMKESQGSHQ